MLSLPQPSWKSVPTLIRILMRLSIHTCSRFRYIEPSFCESGNLTWQIEYDCILQPDFELVNTFLKQFSTSFQKLVSCKVDAVRYNMKDRITLTVTPSPSGSDKTAEESHLANGNKRPRYGIGFVPSSKVTLDQEKSDLTTSVFHDPSKRKRRGSGSQKKSVERYIASSVKIVSERDLSATSSDSESDAKDSPKPETSVASSETTQNAEITAVSVIEPSSDCQLSQSFVNMSLKANETSRAYQLARLNDVRIYGLVRLYLAYLSKQKIEVNIEGETRASLTAKIISEGLPVGEKLVAVWYEYGRMRSLSDEEIKQDLECYYSYCTTSRMMHLQRAKELTRKWLGLRGGSGFPQSSLSVVRENNGPLKDIRVMLDDHLIERFN